LEGHSAAAVIDGSNYSGTATFILLMGDRHKVPGGTNRRMIVVLNREDDCIQKLSNEKVFCY
jgi:hypothetical protein